MNTSTLVKLAIFASFLQTVALGQQNLIGLKKEADEIIAEGPIQARPAVQRVFEAADALVVAGRLTESENYFLQGLMIEPHDYEHHLRFAQALSKEGKQADAKAQLDIILHACEDTALIAKVQKEAGNPSPYVPAFVSEPGDAPQIVLVPLDDVDLLLLQQEQQKLHDDLGIDVQIKSLKVKIGPADRHPIVEIARELRTWLAQFKAQSPGPFYQLLSAASITEAELTDDAKVVKLSDMAMRSNGQDSKADALERLTGKDHDQWLADNLLTALSAAIPADAGKKIRFIGITSHDIYVENTHYVYADSDYQKCAVVSYREFLASFNSEVQSRPRLLRRLHFMCLAQVAHIVGLPRGTDPVSPRSYVNDLEELDAKADRLSDSDREDFAAAFSKL